MNKTKLDDRIENAVSAFFEAAPDSNRFAVTFTGSDTALAADAKPFTEKADKWLPVLREVFMFGPGTFFLFYLTLTKVFFYPTAGLGFYGFLMWFSAVFITWAGSGSIAKVKNLAVPATVIAFALVFAIVSPFLFGRDLADLYFWDSIYLFPFVLIAAKLVQCWIADKK